MTGEATRDDEDSRRLLLLVVLQIAVLRSLPELGAKLLRETLPNFFAAGKSLRDGPVGVECPFLGPDGQTYAVNVLVSWGSAKQRAAEKDGSAA